MQKLKKLTSSNRYPIYSFFITAAIIVIVYLIKNISPFGSNIVSVSDNYHQYSPFLGAFVDQITSGESLIYSTRLGLGSNWLGNIFNYLLSPFNLIALITGSENIHSAMALIILFKGATAAFIFSYFLKKTNEKTGVITSAFGVLYGLSGYFLAFSINVMWLDGFYMFPLVILGLKELVKNSFTEQNGYKPKRRLFVISMAYALITNYYIGYMLCIASVIFYLYLYFSEHSIKEKARNINRFVLTSVAYACSMIYALLLSAVILLPQYLILKTTPAMASSFSWESFITFIINPFEMFSQLCPLYTSNVLTGVAPNIFCGTITVLLVPVYFALKEVSKRKKIALAALMSVFAVSFILSAPNLVWHAFSKPHCFYQRFSFIFSFILLSVAYKAFYRISEIPKKFFWAGSLSLASIVSISYCIAEKNVIMGILYGFVALIICGILYVIAYKPSSVKSATIVLVVLIAAEASLVSLLHIPSYKNPAPENIDISSYTNSRSAIVGWDTPFNTAIYERYNGINGFSSIFPAGLSPTMYLLGGTANALNSVDYNQNLPCFDLLFGIDKILSEKAKDVIPPDPNIYSKIHETDDSALYESKYHTGYGFGILENIPEATVENSSLANQQEWIEKAFGVTDVYTKVETYPEIESDGITVKEENDGYSLEWTDLNNFSYSFTITIEKSGRYYLEYDGTDLNATHIVTINEKDFKEYTMKAIPRVWDIGERKAGDVVKITTKSIEDVKFSPVRDKVHVSLAQPDYDKVEELYQAMISCGILELRENYQDKLIFEGNITTDKVLITIPYDEGWTVYVDGVKVESYREGKSFTGFKTTPGKHTVVMQYSQKGLLEGVVISVIAIMLFITSEIVFAKNFMPSKNLT